MSDTNRTTLSFVVESTYGTQVTGSPLQIIRHTGETLAQQAGSSQSNAIRSDRQVPSIRHTRIDSAGAINFELAYGEFDTLFAAALLDSAWSTPVTDVAADSGIAAVASGNKYTGVDEEFTNYVVGEWVYVAGFAASNNNGYAKITAINSTNPGTLDNDELVVAGLTLTDESAGGSISITQLGAIVNGTTLTSYNFERSYDDLTNTLALYLGQCLNTLSLTVPTEGIVTGSFGLLGSTEQSLSSSGGSGYTAAATTEPFASIDVNKVMEASANMDIVNWSLNLNNNLRTRLVVGSSGVASVGTGRAEVSGTLQAYFESATLYDKFLNETASGLAIVLVDQSSNAIIFDVPQIKYTTGQRSATGPNGDVLADLAWMAYLDPTESVTLRIARRPSA